MIYLIPMSNVRRLLKVHNSLALVIPKPVCRTLDLHAGDYVEIEGGNLPRAGWFRKVILPEKPDEPHPGNRP